MIRGPHNSAPPSFLSPLRQEETIDRDSETRQFQWLIASNGSGYCMAWIIIIVQFDWIPNSIFNDRSLWIWIFSWQTEPSFPENLKNFQGRTFYMQRKIENYLLIFKMSKENLKKVKARITTLVYLTILKRTMRNTFYYISSSEIEFLLPLRNDLCV